MKIRSAIKAVVPPLVDATGLYRYRVRQAVSSRGAVWLVIMYHRVGAPAVGDPFGMGMCVSPGRFREQVRYLTSEFEVLPVPEVLARMREGAAAGRRFASVTFDDGYHDNLTDAAPILAEAGVRPTLFVPSGGWEAGEWFWWDRVVRAFRRTRRERFPLELVDPDAAGSEPLDLTRWKTRVRALFTVLDRLWQVDPDHIASRVESLERQLGIDPPGPDERNRLSPGEVGRLAEQGWEIGAHTVSHPDLTRLPVPRRSWEVRESKRALERKLGCAVRGFAYPAGHFDDATADLVQAAGYEYAVTTDRGINGSRPAPFAILRLGAADESAANLRRCIAGACGRDERRSARA